MTRRTRSLKQYFENAMNFEYIPNEHLLQPFFEQMPDITPHPTLHEPEAFDRKVYQKIVELLNYEDGRKKKDAIPIDLCSDCYWIFKRWVIRVRDFLVFEKVDGMILNSKKELLDAYRLLKIIKKQRRAGKKPVVSLRFKVNSQSTPLSGRILLDVIKEIESETERMRNDYFKIRRGGSGGTLNDTELNRIIEKEIAENLKMRKNAKHILCQRIDQYFTERNLKAYDRFKIILYLFSLAGLPFNQRVRGKRMQIDHNHLSFDEPTMVRTVKSFIERTRNYLIS